MAGLGLSSSARGVARVGFLAALLSAVLILDARPQLYGGVFAQLRGSVVTPLSGSR